MIYEPKVQALLTLFEREIEQYGKYDALGITNKAKKAKDRANTLANRLFALNIEMPGHVRILE